MTAGCNGIAGCAVSISAMRPFARLSEILVRFRGRESGLTMGQFSLSLGVLGLFLAVAYFGGTFAGVEDSLQVFPCELGVFP